MPFEREAPLYLFLAALAAGCMHLSAPVPFGAGFEMIKIAENLAAHGAFANPFGAAETGPTAVNPPLYPFVLAVVMKVFRTQQATMIGAAVINIIANSVTATLLPRVSKLFYDDIRPGVVASILWIAIAQLMPAWDVGLTAAVLLVFCLVSSRPEAAVRPVAHGILVGGLFGCLILLNPSTLLIGAPWVAYLATRGNAPWATVAKYCGTVMLVGFLMSSAWMLRNRFALGAFVIRTNLGMTLNSSLNDCAEPSLTETELNGCYQRHHPNTDLGEASLLRAIGEPRYDDARVKDAWKWVAAHPDRFRELMFMRFWMFWFPSVDLNSLQRVAISLATILSLPGLLLTFRRRWALASYVLAVISLYPLMYYLVVAGARYRYPILWLSLLLAGYAVCWIWQRAWSLHQRVRAA
jgi:hypothetical protein